MQLVRVPDEVDVVGGHEHGVAVTRLHAEEPAVARRRPRQEPVVAVVRQRDVVEELRLASDGRRQVVRRRAPVVGLRRRGGGRLGGRVERLVGVALAPDVGGRSALLGQLRRRSHRVIDHSADQLHSYAVRTNFIRSATKSHYTSGEVTSSVTIRSPFCGYKTIDCVELNGLSLYFKYN